MKRCAIFLYYDREGKVDDYVIYLLKSLKPHISKLLAVCNGTLTAEGTEKLESVADEVMFRANTGFNVGGYREAMFYYGFKELSQYDELIFLDYTFFGPLYPFSEMFDEMDKRDLDFWGITRHHKIESNPYSASHYGCIEEHIQLYFLVLRNRFFTGSDFRDFILNQKNPVSQEEYICEFESVFTKHFADKGYKWDTYVDSKEYEGIAYNPLMFCLKDMIERKRCPVVKRQSFFSSYQDYMMNTPGESVGEAYEYISKNLVYNTELIWENIFRSESMAEISRVMHFNYILPTYASEHSTIEEKTAIFILVNSIEKKSFYREYFQSIPKEMDIYFIGKDAECIELKKEYLPDRENVQVIEKESNYAGKINFILKEAKNKYEYICVANMCKVGNIEPYSNEISWQHSDWENILGSEKMVRNVIETFENNPRLGMLIPPLPSFGQMFSLMSDGWFGSFNTVTESLKSLGINVNMKQEDDPFAPVGGSFWLRVDEDVADILTGIEDEMKIVCLDMPFIVQSAGYFTGILYSDRYASIEMTNQDYMMRETNKAVFRTYGKADLATILERIQRGEISRETEPEEEEEPKIEIKEKEQQYQQEHQHHQHQNQQEDTAKSVGGLKKFSESVFTKIKKK